MSGIVRDLDGRLLDVLSDLGASFERVEAGAYLLGRNLRLREVHFALDEVGDVFLTGAFPRSAVDVVHVDRLLGEVLQLLEESFPALVRAAYGERLAADPALQSDVCADGAGRRPAGTPAHAPRRDVRR